MRDASVSVSVVTPAYNEERHLGRNLESVYNQTYDNIEHVVVDDGSTDRTPEILASHEDQYELRWLSKSNEGQVAAVNQAFEMADGDIVVWMNADDVLLYEWSTSVIAETFEENPEMDVGYSDNGLINEHDELVRFRRAIPKFSHQRLLRHYFASFIFFRAHVVEDQKIEEYDLAMDYEYALRLSAEGYKFSYIDSPVWAYRRHDEAKSTARDEEQSTQSERIQREYGFNSGVQTDLRSLIDKGLFLLYKLYGLERVFSMSRTELACDIDIDSQAKVAVRQLFHV